MIDFADKARINREAREFLDEIKKGKSDILVTYDVLKGVQEMDVAKQMIVLLLEEREQKGTK